METRSECSHENSIEGSPTNQGAQLQKSIWKLAAQVASLCTYALGPALGRTLFPLTFLIHWSFSRILLQAVFSSF